MENVNVILNKEFEEMSQVINCNFDAEILAEKIFDKLVPASGKCDTLGGEIMRAVMRIAYRYYNDGDVAGECYGRETVNPAVRYLVAKVTNVCSFRNVIDKFYECVEMSYKNDDYNYEQMIRDLLHDACVYIIENKLYNVANTEDFWKYRDAECDVDYYEEDDDEYYEEEYDEYYED